MLIEFRFKQDYESPNAKPDGLGGAFFRNFKKGETVVGKIINAGKSASDKPITVVIDKDDYLIKPENLEKVKETEFKTFKEYRATKVISSEDIPKDVKDIVNKVANKNLMNELLLVNRKKARNAILGAVAGAGFAVLTKRNPYIWGIGGFLVGLMIAVNVAKKDKDKKL